MSDTKSVFLIVRVTITEKKEFAKRALRKAISESELLRKLIFRNEKDED